MAVATSIISKEEVLENFSRIASDPKAPILARIRANEVLARHYKLFDDGRDSSRDWLEKMSDEELESMVKGR